MHRGRFKTGTVIPASGIYSVHHLAHRLPHEVTLLKGEIFPKCQKCGDAVTFKVVRMLTCQTAPRNSSWRITLYELPAIDCDDVAKEWVNQPTGDTGSKLMAITKKAKQGKQGKKAKEKGPPTEGLWIAARNSPKGPTGKRAWENLLVDPPSNNRLLELADVALGLKQTNSKKTVV